MRRRFCARVTKQKLKRSKIRENKGTGQMGWPGRAGSKKILSGLHFDRKTLEEQSFLTEVIRRLQCNAMAEGFRTANRLRIRQSPK